MLGLQLVDLGHQLLRRGLVLLCLGLRRSPSRPRFAAPAPARTSGSPRAGARRSRASSLAPPASSPRRVKRRGRTRLLVFADPADVVHEVRRGRESSGCLYAFSQRFAARLVCGVRVAVSLFLPSGKARGVERREALQSVHALRRRASCDRRARLPALHVRHFSIPGRAFRGWHRHPDQPAPGRETLMSPRRSPGPPRCEVTSLARRKPHPTPLAQRLMRTPSVGWDIGIYSDTRNTVNSPSCHSRARRPALARSASYGGFRVRRSAERIGGRREPGVTAALYSAGLASVLAAAALAWAAACGLSLDQPHRPDRALVEQHQRDRERHLAEHVGRRQHRRDRRRRRR